jgi:cytochrome oxidase assembly protein ShyY1
VSWRFALTPKWLVRHVLVVLLVAVMIVAMFWQIGRLHDKRAYKSLVERRERQPAAQIADVLPADAPTRGAVVEGALYRHVLAEGTYADEQTVIVENRTFDGASGGWVLTPLVLGDGDAVVVNRGFVGYDRNGEIVAPPAPSGTVRVEGLLFPSQHRGSFGAVDPTKGTLPRLARVDLDRYQAQVAEDLFPAYVQLATSRPAEAPARAGQPQLVALGAPELSEGPHLGYAAQWAIFSTIAAGGYVILLRRVARDSAREQALAAAG